jgi:hypothetical protein
MTRPRKNNADYFSHDKTMRNDSKIKAVRIKFGNEGHSIWCQLLETLTDCEDFRLVLANQIDWEILAGDFMIDVVLLKQIIDYFIKLKLIVKDGTNLFCPKLIERFSPLLEDRERKREWRENKGKEVKDGTNQVKDGTNSINPVANPQSKVKESKVKNIYTQSEFISLDYIGQLRKEKRKDLQIIGYYFEEAKMDFPSKEAADKELRRWLPTAKVLKEYNNDRLAKAFKKAKIEYPTIWKLSTIEKIIPTT